jgi:hypothetical protein
MPEQADWPALPLEEWRDTQATLHMWLQILGKIKLALAPFLNEWWQVAFTVSARGLTSGPIPYAGGVFDMELDFLSHNLSLRTSAGGYKALPLVARSVARFYAEVMAALAALGIEVRINPLPAEVPNPISCEQNEVNCSYEPEFVERWWRILVLSERVVQRFRSGFIGKSSPLQLFWGAFDLAHSRFSGRAAEPPPNASRMFKLSEDQENFTCGFWPGNATSMSPGLGAPAFYAYAYPAPPGFSEAGVRPVGAMYRVELGEFVLPYEAVRRAESPPEAVLEFFQSTYDAAANLGSWVEACWSGRLKRAGPEARTTLRLPLDLLSAVDELARRDEAPAPQTIR